MWREGMRQWRKKGIGIIMKGWKRRREHKPMTGKGDRQQGTILREREETHFEWRRTIHTKKTTYLEATTHISNTYKITTYSNKNFSSAVWCNTCHFAWSWSSVMAAMIWLSLEISNGKQQHTSSGQSSNRWSDSVGPADTRLPWGHWTLVDFVHPRTS